MSDLVDTSKKPDIITITVDGIGKGATYCYSGEYVDANGNIDYKDKLEGEVQIQFKVKTKGGGEQVSFFTWPQTASSLYIDGVPAGEERGQFRNYKRQDNKWLVIDDLNDDKAQYDYTIWLTNGSIHWPLDPTIQNN